LRALVERFLCAIMQARAIAAIIREGQRERERERERERNEEDKEEPGIDRQDRESQVKRRRGIGTK